MLAVTVQPPDGNRFVVLMCPTYRFVSAEPLYPVN